LHRRFHVGTAGCGTTTDTAATPAPGVTPEAVRHRHDRVNPWVGYAANVAVISYLAKHELGCKVAEKELTEDDSWKGMAKARSTSSSRTGATTTSRSSTSTSRRSPSSWASPATRRPRLVRAAVAGQEVPDITDWQNLNKYSTQFKTAKTGGKASSWTATPRT